MAYLFWKLLHIASVIMFLGNITTGVFWAARAHKTKDFKLIASTFQSIIISDRYFTIPGVVGVTVAGFFAAINGGYPILGTGWILWGIILFTISGLSFSFYVGPLQKKIYALATSSNADWDNYIKLYKQWGFWGLIATITPIAAMIIMILKPLLPGL